MKAFDTLELTHRITRRTLDGILPDKYCLALLATDHDSSTGFESATIWQFHRHKFFLPVRMHVLECFVRRG